MIDKEDFDEGTIEQKEEPETTEERNIRVAVRASKEAEFELRRKERDYKENKRKEPRVHVKAQLETLGNEKLDEVFKKYGKYYHGLLLRSRYKPAHDKFKEGYLVRMKEYIREDNENIAAIDAGSFTVSQSYRGVDVSLLDLYVQTSIIRFNDNTYVEFKPTWEGLLGLGAIIAVYLDDKEMLFEVVLSILERMLEISPGDIDLAGSEDIINRCYKTIMADDPRLANRHILLAGPPGCGKSMIAKKIIKMTPELLHFNVTSDMHWGNIMPMLSEIVRQCNKRLVIVIDEIDEAGLNRDTSRDSVYQLLRVLDGTADLKNITFLATTNRPGDLDIALLRTGRFGPIMVVDAPDEKQYRKIVEYYCDKYDANINVDEVIKYREKMTGCDIRTAFEDCIIFEEDITTENVVKNLKRIKEGKTISTMIYA